MIRLVVAIALGALFGLTGPQYLFLGWFSLIPWGIAGLALGYWSQRAERVLVGVLYGFALCFSFMIAGYTGTASLVSRLPFFAVVGVFGALCGLGLTMVGHHMRSKRAPSREAL
jgi:hypothetical protein